MPRAVRLQLYTRDPMTIQTYNQSAPQALCAIARVGVSHSHNTWSALADPKKEAELLSVSGFGTA